MDIFKELKNGEDFNYDAYSAVSDLLVEYCERKSRYFSDFILKLKVGKDIYNVYASFDANNYSFEFLWDWYEGEDTVQILDLKSIHDVFEEGINE